MTTTPRIVYFSSVSENTRRFVDKLGFPAERIPLYRKEELIVDYPYVLIVPTYGGGDLRKAVPVQVRRFLGTADNSRHMLGVISSGNTNFGDVFCAAGRLVSQRFQVPELYHFELLGTRKDCELVATELPKRWAELEQMASEREMAQPARA